MPPPIPKTRAAPSLWVFVVINLAAFPGLGSIMAKRREGYVQATLMVAGFLLLMGFMTYYLYCMYQLIRNQGTIEELKAAISPYYWSGYSGLALSVTAWLWALASSLSLIRQSKAPRSQRP